MKSKLKRLLYFVKTGYLTTAERVNPDFPDENFQNHLKVYKFVSQFAAGNDVFDCGCGTGYGTAHLAGIAKSIVGVDISQSALRWAKKHYPHIDYRQMDVHHLQFPDNSFDFVISTENFEHLTDQKGHAAELARVIRPNGLVLVASPNPEMTIGQHNRFHTRENSYEELLELFSNSFNSITILENLKDPPTEEGRAGRKERWDRGMKGGSLPPEVDLTSLHNTHSFFCFLKQPRKP
jgi:2-polyprenyl-3-methyl-5-hydroxy-6-metoxy-1,4-benzoquinol methylase